MLSISYTEILKALLSGFGYPVYDEANKKSDPNPIKIVVWCECRDVTDEEENKDVLN